MAAALLLQQEAHRHRDEVQPVNRELLAMVATFHHFRFLLEGHIFRVLMDHKPLVFALHRARDACQLARATTWPTWLSSHLTCTT